MYSLDHAAHQAVHGANAHPSCVLVSAFGAYSIRQSVLCWILCVLLVVVCLGGVVCINIVLSLKCMARNFVSGVIKILGIMPTFRNIHSPELACNIVNNCSNHPQHHRWHRFQHRKHSSQRMSGNTAPEIPRTIGSNASDIRSAFGAKCGACSQCNRWEILPSEVERTVFG